jgi:hypothetical protein
MDFREMMEEPRRSRRPGLVGWVIGIVGLTVASAFAGSYLSQHYEFAYEFAWEHPSPSFPPSPRRPETPAQSFVSAPRQTEAEASQERTTRLDQEARDKAALLAQEKVAVDAELAEHQRQAQAVARKDYNECMGLRREHIQAWSDEMDLVRGIRSRSDLTPIVEAMQALRRDLRNALGCTSTFNEALTYRLKAENIALEKLMAYRAGSDTESLNLDAVEVDVNYYARLEKDALTRIRWAAGIYP